MPHAALRGGPLSSRPFSALGAHPIQESPHAARRAIGNTHAVDTTQRTPLHRLCNGARSRHRHVGRADCALCAGGGSVWRGRHHAHHRDGGIGRNRRWGHRDGTRGLSGGAERDGTLPRRAAARGDGGYGEAGGRGDGNCHRPAGATPACIII